VKGQTPKKFETYITPVFAGRVKGDHEKSFNLYLPLVRRALTKPEEGDYE
jgi:hypothetical protein